MLPANHQSVNETNPTNQEPLCNNPAKEIALRELSKATGYSIKQVKIGGGMLETVLVVEGEQRIQLGVYSQTLNCKRCQSC